MTAKAETIPVEDILIPAEHLFKAREEEGGQMQVSGDLWSDGRDFCCSPTVAPRMRDRMYPQLATLCIVYPSKQHEQCK